MRQAMQLLKPCKALYNAICADSKETHIHALQILNWFKGNRATAEFCLTTIGTQKGICGFSLIQIIFLRKANWS